MHWLWEHFLMAGWVAWPILLLGLVGAGLSLVLVVLIAVGAQQLRQLGMLALTLAALLAGLGILGVFLGHQQVDDAVSAPSISPTQRAHIRRIGYEESRSAAWLGLILCSLPLVAGVFGTAIGHARRQQPPQPAAVGVLPLASPPEVATTPTRGVALPVGIGVGAVLCVGGAVAALLAPLPGPDLARDDPTWWALDAIDRIEAGQLQEGCRDLEAAAAGKPGRPQVDLDQVPGCPAAVTRCIDYWIDEASQKPAALAREALQALARNERPFVSNPEQRKRIDAELAKLEPQKPDQPDAGADAEAAAGVAVSGRLSPEVVARVVRQNNGRFRLCYEQALRTHPGLAGTIKVRFVIGRDGIVSNVGSSSSLDPTFVQCVVRSFYGLSFPQPEGGIVTVSYPLRFEPDAENPAAQR